MKYNRIKMKGQAISPVSTFGCGLESFIQGGCTDFFCCHDRRTVERPGNNSPALVIKVFQIGYYSTLGLELQNGPFLSAYIIDKITAQAG